jgi:cellulose synthase/poly-beta-1,6-N-acetylglucosamine synthase-like glycosyltransferase
MKTRDFKFLPDVISDLAPPITVIIPAKNERNTIVQSIRSVLSARYPNLQIIVVNDESTDGTLDLLKEKYDLSPSDDVYRDAVKTAPVKEIYRSHSNAKIRVIDKKSANAKGDAINAGINLADTPLVCCIDADSILDPNCFRTLVEPFITNSDTVAAGGTIRVANGSDIEGSKIKEVGISWHPLEMFQVIEYLRAFLFGRMGWVPFNGLPIISGALGMFDRQTLIDIGGFRNDSVSEDMEVILRMHRKLSETNRSYEIDFVPDPICWTMVPDDINSLRSQRISWQQGLGESLFWNLSLLGNTSVPGVGLMSFPFLLAIEFIGSVIEVAGYLYMALGVMSGYLSPMSTAAFFLVSIGFGMFNSVFTILLEVISFSVYSKISQLFKLFLAAIGENLGYRQVNSLWRMYGLFRYLLGKRGYPGKKKKKAFNE